MAGTRSILRRVALLAAMPLALSMAGPAAALAPDTITPRPVAHPVSVSEAGKALRPHPPSPCEAKDYPTREALAMCWANWANSVSQTPK